MVHAKTEQQIIREKLIRWLISLISSGLTGVGVAFGSVVIAPDAINLDKGLNKFLLMLLLGFGAGVFNFFQKSPLDVALYGSPTATHLIITPDEAANEPKNK